MQSSIATESKESVSKRLRRLALPLSTPIRILLVDDHMIFREVIVSLLCQLLDLRVVGEAASMQEAITLAGKLKPDLVMLGINLPDGTSRDATQAILAINPSAKIVILTVLEDDERLFSAIRAGASGYLIKSVRAAELLKQLRALATGEVVIAPSVARRILEEFARPTDPLSVDLTEATKLTEQEIEVVQQLARGATNGQIARRLVMSENTVNNHLRNVLGKLHRRSRREISN